MFPANGILDTGGCNELPRGNDVYTRSVMTSRAFIPTNLAIHLLLSYSALHPKRTG